MQITPQIKQQRNDTHFKSKLKENIMRHSPTAQLQSVHQTPTEEMGLWTPIKVKMCSSNSKRFHMPRPEIKKKSSEGKSDERFLDAFWLYCFLFFFFCIVFWLHWFSLKVHRLAKTNCSHYKFYKTSENTEGKKITFHIDSAHFLRMCTGWPYS